MNALPGIGCAVILYLIAVVLLSLFLRGGYHDDDERDR